MSLHLIFSLIIFLAYISTLSVAEDKIELNPARASFGYWNDGKKDSYDLGPKKGSKKQNLSSNKKYPKFSGCSTGPSLKDKSSLHFSKKPNSKNNPIKFKISGSAGTRVQSANDKTTFSSLGRISTDLRYKEMSQWLATGSFFYDLNDESADPYKYKHWGKIESELSAYPIKLNIFDSIKSKALSGFIIRGDAVENTPSSEEFYYRAETGASIVMRGETYKVRFILGGYYYFLELDDDLPILNGYERENLQVESYGVVLSSSFLKQIHNFEIENKNSVYLDVNGYFREINSQVAATYQLLGKDKTQCSQNSIRGVYLKLSVGGRYFDLDDKSDALGFNHDVFSELQVILEFGE